MKNVSSEPQIVLSIDDSYSVKKLQSLKKYTFHLLELRIDKCHSMQHEHLKNYLKELKKIKIPLIATIRSRKEGGQSSCSDSKRLELFNQIISFIDYIDIELSSKNILKRVVSLAHDNNKKVILSYHNFQKTPSLSYFNSIIQSAKLNKADLIKIAVKANSKTDLIKLCRLCLSNIKNNIVVIAMGERGLISRVFFPAIGSKLTYTFFSHSTAPGQLSIDKMQHLIDLFY